jgi:D-inositol-3-phosphate glycosyltransferase
MTQLAQEKTEDRGPRTCLRQGYGAASTGPKSEVSAQRAEGRNLSSVVGGQSSVVRNSLHIALLTGGGDKPYALGIASALTSAAMHVDFIGSDDLSVPELLANPRLNFLNLRGDQRGDANLMAKVLRVLRYYLRLIGYAANAKPKLFHILWNNKFQLFDRTVLMLYYRLLRKKIVFTAHNVNAGKRDQNDSWLNRMSLKMQYRLSDQIFVHTEGMKTEMVAEFRIPEDKVSVIPFGINNTVPDTKLSSAEAKRRLGLNNSDKAVLCFGNIAPYKGLEYLVAAVSELLTRDRNYRLLIVGKPREREKYWSEVQRSIENSDIADRVIAKIEYVPDDETELYFKAADVLVLPYARVFQSGVLFLGYNFGLPVIAAAVASLKEEIIEGETGFVFKPGDPSDLADKIDRYFNSDLFHSLASRRAEIKAYANDRYSWNKVAAITTKVYSELLNSDS